MKLLADLVLSLLNLGLYVICAVTLLSLSNGLMTQIVVFVLCSGGLLVPFSPLLWRCCFGRHLQFPADTTGWACISYCYDPVWRPMVLLLGFLVFGLITLVMLCFVCNDQSFTISCLVAPPQTPVVGVYVMCMFVCCAALCYFMNTFMSYMSVSHGVMLAAPISTPVLTEANPLLPSLNQIVKGYDACEDRDRPSITILLTDRSDR